MNNKPNILFTATFSTPFIQADNIFFSKYYHTRTIIRSGIPAIFRCLLALKNYSISFSWFASTYSSFLVLLARIFGKKAVIVLGGVDTAKIPELNYGIWNSRWKSALVGYGIRNADRILAVDESLKNEAIALARYDGKNITVVPTGYDATFWTPGGPKENIVLTVAQCTDRNRGMIKGLDFLSVIARTHPDVRFVLIGTAAGLLPEFGFPPNVATYEFLPHARLIEFYRRAKVYLHPSRREGLPNTLCEAMLCECFPIGTDTGGIPHAIGTTGLVVRFNGVHEAGEAIRLAMKTDSSPAARQRIIEHFSRERRENTLTNLIDSLARG